MMPALMACTSSPMPGTSTTTVDIREFRHFHFILAHADRFDQNHVLAGGIQQQRHVGSGSGQPAEMPARGHGTDEHPGVGVMAEHADAVAQNRATGVRAGGIHREHSNRLPSRRSSAEPADPSACFFPRPARR